MAAQLILKILGLKEWRRDLGAAARKIPGEQLKNTRKAAEIIVGQARKEFKGSRTRARRKKRPVTSPPDKLGVDIGTYRKQISATVRRRGKSVVAEVGPVGLVYPVLHEYGLGRMPKRQVITPAVEKTEDKQIALIGRTFKVLR